MFDKEVRLTGKHARYMILLANNLGETNAKLFNRNIDVYVQAPIVGFLYKRKGSKDNDMKDPNGKVYDAHILKDQMLNAKDNLVFNMQLILLWILNMNRMRKIALIMRFVILEKMMVILNFLNLIY